MFYRLKVIRRIATTFSPNTESFIQEIQRPAKGEDLEGRDCGGIDRS